MYIYYRKHIYLTKNKINFIIYINKQTIILNKIKKTKKTDVKLKKNYLVIIKIYLYLIY